MTRANVMAVVGAQFGSEGKGMIVEKFAQHFDVHVRTGAPNAGHTYYVDCPHVHVDEAYRDDVDHPQDWRCNDCGQRTPLIGDGKLAAGRAKVVARSIPVGACNRNAWLIIGPGALIDAELLVTEVNELDALGLDVRSRLIVDEKAMLIDPIRHHGFEGGVRGFAHAAIGSTGEGVGPARMAKIARGTFSASPAPGWSLIDSVGKRLDFFAGNGIQVADTATYLNMRYDLGASILLEGTQGSGLSLIHGPWPYVTSSDTNAAQLCVDAGLAPQLVTDVMLVARSFPIRVAGNSGPLPLETTWEQIGQPEERTTVTKKVRRVAHWSNTLFHRAVMLNRPTSVALTFGDYWWPDLAGRQGNFHDLDVEQQDRLSAIAFTAGAPVSVLGTGPDSVIWTQMPVPFTRATNWPTAAAAYGA